MIVLQIYITRNYCYQIVITGKSITVIPTTKIGLLKSDCNCLHGPCIEEVCNVQL